MTGDYVLRIATRGSPLARYQADYVGKCLTATEAISAYKTVIVRTEADRDLLRPIADFARQGAFTSEVERAVIEGRADVAVHSAKDLPSSGLSDELTLAAAPIRSDSRDALVGRDLDELREGGTVATGSIRRRVQLQQLLPEIEFTELRGNIENRLSKVPPSGSAVFALAGLLRLGLDRHVRQVLDTEQMVPQVGQGTLALRCRADDRRCIAALQRIDDEEVHRVLRAERAFLGRLGGGCDMPVGAHGTLDGSSGLITLEGVLASHDGRHLVRARTVGDDPQRIGVELAEELPRLLCEREFGERH